MDNKNTTIYEFEFELIRDYFYKMERQGPGSPEITKKALSFIENLSEESLIADIGCGTGGQTIVIGQHTNAYVTGIDIFPLFINKLNENARKLGLENKVKGETGSMDALTFREEELDLIWSEGAIYFVGFEQGLNMWKKFLKKDGYVAVTEVSWFTEKRPEEIEDFWMEAYPGIDTIPNKMAQMQRAGYVPVASFILPEYCWTKEFYELQHKIQQDFLSEKQGLKAAADFIAYQQYEENLYHKYKDYYGYVFYIGKKI